jgi:methyl-accepting chemotaxis protein
MKFKTRIWLLPISAAMVFVIGQVVNVVVSQRTSEAMNALTTVDTPYLQALERIERQADEFRLTLQSAASEGDDSRLSEVQAVVEKVHDTLRQAATIEGKQEPSLSLLAAFDAYQTPALQATQAMLKRTDGGNAMERMQSGQTNLINLLQAETKAAQAAVASQNEKTSQGINTSLLVNLVTGVVVLLVLGGASWFIVRSVWTDLGDEPDTLRRLASDVADGQLIVRQDQNNRPEQSLAAAMVRMASNLRETVSTIRLASDSIAAAASEISSGNQDLSQRTEQAASNLQQTASSMAQLKGTIDLSAASANVANTVARQAETAATRGGELVNQVIQSMQGIDDASRKIQEIIGVIDSIAFQTNILALNAAVEAARAGEQGRGFAVVASEVRSLAQRSAGAAKEIKELIGTSSVRVEQGSLLVKDAGSAMDEILEGVRKVASTLGEIATSSTEQSNGIGIVNEAVTQLDHMTQQNSALVEEAAAAASSLQDQALTMAQTVARFKVDET